MSASKSYFIAEAGVNHSGSLDLALEMVETASLAGASAVKFQAYTADSLAAKDSPAYWDLTEEPTSTQHSLFLQHECSDFNFYSAISDFCKQKEIDFLVSCFSVGLVDLLDPLVLQHKISSSDLTNFPLVAHIASKNKPIILSCGASSIDEISSTVDLIRSINSKHLTLMHCVLNYPCPPENANISFINTLFQKFKSESISIGYSCHIPCLRY